MDIKLGQLFYETEEMTNSEKHFALAHATMTPFKIGTSTLEADVIDCIEALNGLCMVNFQWEAFDKALEYLLSAVSVHDMFVSQTDRINTNMNNGFEKAYTMTTFFLAQVYGKLEEVEKSAEFCWATLKRQYESQSFDHTQFTLNCLQIAPYFFSKQNWNQACYCIAVAFTMAKSLGTNPGQEEDKEALDANISLFVGKLYLEFFECLHTSIAQGSFDIAKGWLNPQSRTSDPPLAVFSNFNIDASFKIPTFCSLDLIPKPAIPLSFESQIIKLAYEGVSAFNDSLHYYILEGFTTEHISISMELSSLHRFVEEMIEDRKTKRKLLKTRAGILEPILKEISPVHYFTEYRQLLYECGEIYESLADLSELPSPDGTDSNSSSKSTLDFCDSTKILKVNKQVITAISFYQKFVDTYMENGGQKLPAQLDPDHHLSFFTAYLNIAKLYQKFRTTDIGITVGMAKKAAAHYKLICSLAKAYRPAVLLKEIALCQELEMLLTRKAMTLEKSSSSKSPSKS